jgi:hypothetical protein
LLQTQVKTFLSQVPSLGEQFVRAQFSEFFDFHVKRPSRGGVLKISSAPAVCPRQGAEIHARLIPAHHPAQIKYFPDAPSRPSTRVAHTRFRWARRHRFIRENADPQFAFAFHIASERDTRGFQLRVGNPGAFERL